MLSSLKTKIIVPSVLVLILLVALMLMYVTWSVNSLVDYLADDRIEGMSNAALEYVAALEHQTLLSAAAISSSGELVRLMNAGNRQAILSYLIEQNRFLGVDSIILSDNQGYIIVRTHLPDMYGDSGAHVPTISNALEGRTVTIYTLTPTTPIIMASAMPVYDGDELIGTVVATFDLATDEFIDRLAKIFSADVTVFRWDESIVSTLRLPGTDTRATGTTAAPLYQDQCCMKAEILPLI